MSTLSHLILCIALATLVSMPAIADIPALADASLMVSQDKTSGRQGLSYDANAAEGFFNAGFSFRHWNKDITAWNGRHLNNEGTFFAGLGFFNLIQVQRGFSNAGARTRIRSDIVLSDQFPFASNEKWGRFKKGIVLTPFVEIGSGKRVYGLGIGLQVD